MAGVAAEPAVDIELMPAPVNEAAGEHEKKKRRKRVSHAEKRLERNRIAREEEAARELEGFLFGANHDELVSRLGKETAAGGEEGGGVSSNSSSGRRKKLKRSGDGRGLEEGDGRGKELVSGGGREGVDFPEVGFFVDIPGRDDKEGGGEALAEIVLGTKKMKKKERKAAVLGKTRTRADGTALLSEGEEGEDERGLLTSLSGDENRDGDWGEDEDRGERENEEEDEEDGEGESADEDDGEDEEGEGAGETLPPPAWTDPDDEKLSVDISSVNRLRKLREGEGEVRVSGGEYEARLRLQHQKMMGGGRGLGWAELSSALPSKTLPAKSRIKGRSGEEDEEYGELEESGGILAMNDVLVAEGGGRTKLLPGRIAISRAKDANQQEPSKSVVQSVNFHPNGELMLTAGFDKRLRFFKIDGKENAKLQSVFFQDTPIFKARFCSGGTKVLVSGRRKWYYMYDVVAGRMERINGIIGRNEKSLESFEVSPCADVAAFLCADGNVSLVSLRSRQWVGTLKLNGSVRSVAFCPDGRQLAAAGGDGDVYHFDLRTMRCLHRGVDHGNMFGGGNNATALAVSPDGRHLATGSASGVVNLYDRHAFLSHAAASSVAAAAAVAAAPRKVLTQLTTTADCLAFSPDSQILAMSSRMAKDALRLVHVASGTVFSNWPTARTPLQHVHCAEFNSSGAFLAAGNARGRVLLYQLHHYRGGG